MTESERIYSDILALKRPENPEILRKHPRMALEDRAKIFAPFSALRGLTELLSEEDEKLLRIK